MFNCFLIFQVIKLFTCRGCQEKYHDKDLGVILEYSLENGQDISLFFCYPPQTGCWLPTTYYMLSNMSPEERMSVRSAMVHFTNIYMELERSAGGGSLEEMFRQQKKVINENPLEDRTFKKPLSHYQEVGLKLAQGDYKRSSDMIGIIEQTLSQRSDS